MDPYSYPQWSVGGGSSRVSSCACIACNATCRFLCSAASFLYACLSRASRRVQACRRTFGRDVHSTSRLAYLLVLACIFLLSGPSVYCLRREAYYFAHFLQIRHCYKAANSPRPYPMLPYRCSALYCEKCHLPAICTVCGRRYVAGDKGILAISGGGGVALLSSAATECCRMGCGTASIVSERRWRLALRMAYRAGVISLHRPALQHILLLS